jgi:hypothetical protein
VKPPSETPLSDLIADHFATGTHQSYARFLEQFRSSLVGIIAVGIPPGVRGDYVSTAEHPVSLGQTGHAGGRPMVLAFADPAAFERRFGRRFNAALFGEAVLAAVLLNPKCEGVLVNSALAEESVVIDRGTAEALARSGDPLAKRKPWWRFW